MYILKFLNTVKKLRVLLLDIIQNITGISIIILNLYIFLIFIIKFIDI